MFNRNIDLSHYSIKIFMFHLNVSNITKHRLFLLKRLTWSKSKTIRLNYNPFLEGRFSPYLVQLGICRLAHIYPLDRVGGLRSKKKTYLYNNFLNVFLLLKIILFEIIFVRSNKLNIWLNKFNFKLMKKILILKILILL